MSLNNPHHVGSNISQPTTSEGPLSPKLIPPHLETLSRSDSPSSSEEQLSTQESAPTTEFVKVIRKGNYWPTIRKFINNGGINKAGRRVKLRLECPICYDEMLHFPTPVFLQRQPFLLHTITVLFCGHVFHRKCMDDCVFPWRLKAGNERSAPIRSGDSDDDYEPKCPCCRESLIYQECGHAMDFKDLTPWYPKHIEGDLPHVRDEGGSKPARCTNCQLEEIKKAVKRTASLICEPGAKDIRSQADQRYWEQDLDEDLQETAKLKYRQWAQYSRRW